MFADERQNIIHEYIRKRGAITTATLINEFNVSVETVRRDLLSMEKRGLLKRVHGGAVALSGLRPFNELKERNKEFVEEKRELSLNAAKYVNEGDILFVDAGSTAIQFASVLKERFTALTIVTHSLDVFNDLCCHKDFKVILCGGFFLEKEKAFYGSMVLESLNQICVQKAFIFPSSVSLEFGICDYEEKLVPIQKYVLERTDDVYVPADSGKFEKKAFLKLSDMKREYHYITDSKLSDELNRLYKENGISVFTGEKKECKDR